MPNKHGDFIWYELLTSDANASQDFYGRLLGWTFADSGQPGVDYRQFTAGEHTVGGMMPISADMAAGGARPTWLGYIAVDDVDATVSAVKAAGGAVHMPPWDIPGVGRAAFVADAQSALFYVMRPIPPAGKPDASSHSFAATNPAVGQCAWNELATSDQPAAVEFYTSQFGWRQEGDMDMGPMGKYQFFYHGPDMIGAVWPKMPEMPVSAWSYYFRVADIDAAVRMIKANGGSVMQEPIEIPGGEFSIVGTDPQGAVLALMGPRK